MVCELTFQICICLTKLIRWYSQSQTLTIVAQSLAFFPVSLYIPAYSAAIGLSTFDGTVALTCFNLARVVGQIGLGDLCDRMMYTHLIIISGALSALSAFLMWGFAHNLASVFAFVVVFGIIVSFSPVSVLGSPDCWIHKRETDVLGRFCRAAGSPVWVHQQAWTLSVRSIYHTSVLL